MKIEKVEKVTETNYYITTDDEHWYFYRRSENGDWEVLMGESWETLFLREQEMERAFQEFLYGQEQ